MSAATKTILAMISLGALSLSVMTEKGRKAWSVFAEFMLFALDVADRMETISVREGVVDGLERQLKEASTDYRRMKILRYGAPSQISSYDAARLVNTFYSFASRNEAMDFLIKRVPEKDRDRVWINTIV